MWRRIGGFVSECMPLVYSATLRVAGRRHRAAPGVGLGAALLLVLAVGGGGVRADGDFVPANVAYGSSATASSTYGTHSAGMAVDYDSSHVGTYWQAVGNSAPGAWLELDLGRAEVVGAYDLYQTSGDCGTCGAVAYDVQYSTDDVVWWDALVVTGGTAHDASTFTSHYARYWRVLDVESMGWVWAISDLELWRTGAAPTGTAEVTTEPTSGESPTAGAVCTAGPAGEVPGCAVAVVLVSDGTVLTEGVVFGLSLVMMLLAALVVVTGRRHV